MLLLIKLGVEATVTLISGGTLRIVVCDLVSPLLAAVQSGALRASWQIVAYEYVATRVRSENLVINSVMCARAHADECECSVAVQYCRASCRTRHCGSVAPFLTVFDKLNMTPCFLSAPGSMMVL